MTATNDSKGQVKTGYDMGLKIYSDFSKGVKDMPKQEDLIETILPYGQVMLIAGDPWQGKSLLAQRTAFAFGAGGDFHGLKLSKCRAFYITWEGSTYGIEKRLASMYEDIKPELEPVIKLMPEATPLNTDSGYQIMYDLIKQAKDLYDVKVVIFDSFPYIFKGNVKEDKAINEWWDKLQKLVKSLEITPIIIWEVSKLPIDGNSPREQFTINRVKGASTISYKVNTIIAIGELKKSERKQGGLEYVSKGYRLVVLKAKDAGKMDWLEVSLNPSTLSYEGQKWQFDEASSAYKAKDGE